ncbi:MAG: hypothetical protein QXM43_02250 [Desulfurococcaceae archaeon]
MKDEAEIADPIPIDSPIHEDADAILFPQVYGELYNLLKISKILFTNTHNYFRIWYF